MKKVYYLGATALLTLLSACSSEDLKDLNEQSYQQQNPLAVHINATVGKNVIARSNPTDDTKQTAFNNGDQISVAVEGQKAVIYTKSGDSWSPQSGSYLKWTKTPLTFNAYYLVNATTSMTTFSVPEDQSTPDKIKEADYMTFSGSKDKPSSAYGKIDIEMKRKMARVVIDGITFNDQYETGYSVRFVNVLGNTTGYENGNTKLGNLCVESYKSTESKFYALLSPTTEAAGTKFLTVKKNDAADTEQGDVLTITGIPTMQAGYSYSYTLTVGKNKAEISSVTVKEWNDGGQVIEGDGYAEKYEMK